MFLAIIFGSIVGLALGLTGGGGTILAVPFLVYGLGFEVRQSVALSLLVVSITALYGAILQASIEKIFWKPGLLLGLGGISAVPLGVWIAEQLPHRLILLLFAMLMFYIGLRMILGKSNSRELIISPPEMVNDESGDKRFSKLKDAFKLLFVGGATGILSGAFGVGGGFLLVPAILLVTGLKIKQAMATSLVAICIIALSGFFANLQFVEIENITPAIWFLFGSAVGMSLGSYTRHLLSPRILNNVFGGAVICVAVYIVLKNI